MTREGVEGRERRVAERSARLAHMGALAEAQAIVRYYGATLEEVFGASRVKHVAQARHDLAAFIRSRFGYSYPALGAFFNRDHTTMMASVKKARPSVVAEGRVSA